jgi:alpha-1,3-rhamnosyl/mannosyltransferase
MNVTLVVDALTPQLSGIGRYTWELCKRLPEQPGIDRLNYFSTGVFLDDPSVLLQPEPAFATNRKPGWLRRWADRGRLRNSLFHGPNYFLPPVAETGIVTVHDLSVFRHPETHPDERIREFEREFQSSISRACHIITDTETIRRELLDLLPLRKEDVSAVHLGVSSEYRPRSPADLEISLRQWRLRPHGYALCVSTLEPRKKILELLLAWRELPPAIRNATPLVLVGGEGWLSESLHRCIEQGAADGWLKYLGFVPEHSLPSLYSGAALFLYPSTYEGFGLPPVEAMASGVPTVVSNASCLSEVCGGAVAYVDPNDIPAFAAAIVAALTDVEWRRSSRELGLDRAARYTWDNCVAKTAEIYRLHCPVAAC